MHVDVFLPCEHERQGSFEVVRWSETAILEGAPAVSGGDPRVGTFSEQVWGLSAERRHAKRNEEAHARRLIAQLERLGHTVVLDPVA